MTDVDRLSDKLKGALGLADGEPPPWLANMQRHGPPPSNPGLRVPGLNAPTPEGAVRGTKRVPGVAVDLSHSNEASQSRRIANPQESTEVEAKEETQSTGDVLAALKQGMQG
uniref:PSP proline-rich domain-containing protein n=1 Tax=Alexandrium andersonii TaxID=327968 RepID=A0A7S2DDH9_9DINO|mmetsp:Transcript_51816/g.117175  ORF Transcript_51816/g.117175 Transcript_51816/m.117175 type:complete len:112 (+) Transcript_51816:66-401(+)